MSGPEFYKAVRALSVRYVERRSDLSERSALDSAGKRAAFAAYYAPLHFLTTREIVQAIAASAPDAPVLSIDRLCDFGCGTGTASAAWALECGKVPAIFGTDTSGWALDEAEWTWRKLGLSGRVRRNDLVQETERWCRADGHERAAWLFAWSINELRPVDRENLLRIVKDERPSSTSVLVIEPLARGVTPWWDDWARRLDANVAEWRFDVELPAELAQIREAAGFRREALTARTLWCPPRPRR
jgi:hypothetical protein